MTTGQPETLRRVIIISSHPLFGQGLRSLLHERAETVVVDVFSNVEEAIRTIDLLPPDLVIVDYDDERVNRDEFLAHFLEGGRQLRVVLLSLKEGGSHATVYDRRMLSATQIEDWLKEWDYQQKPSSSLPGEESLLNGSNPAG
jgi:chemotaxis response regulator CheB